MVQTLQTVLRRADVERATGLPRSTIYELIAKGKFPRPIPISGRAVGWLESELLQWQRDRIAQREAGRAS